VTAESRRLFQYLVKEIESTHLPREAVEEIVEVIGKNFEKYKKTAVGQLDMSEVLRVFKEKERYKDSTDLHLLV